MQGDGSVAVLAPVFALSYPLLDTGIAILRRWLRGVPLSRGDGRHIHHQLLALGLSPRRAVSVIYFQSAAVAALGLSVAFAPPAMTVAIAAAGGAVLFFIMVYGLRWLQYHEFVEAGASVAAAARNARTVIQDKIHARDIAWLVQSAATIDQVSAILAESASKFRFEFMQLRRRSATNGLPDLALESQAQNLWRLEYPILRDGDTQADPLVLSIWCRVGGSRHPAGAERVVQILAPAIVLWASGQSAEALESRVLVPAPALAMPQPTPPLTATQSGRRDRPRRQKPLAS
jgi:UDP-GlcNAc:undecaprenyl-phosphate GlcNAc-1-phosphate transferase